MKKSLLVLLMTSAMAWAGSYPLGTCVVSGEKLGAMGKPHVFVYEGTEVRLCCPQCKAAFDKNPAKYLAKLAAAAKPAK